MAPARKKPLTRTALDDVPPNMIGEIIDGELYMHPRPRPLHMQASSALTAELMIPFAFGRGGPGGWHILVEPGIELPGSPEIVPDVAGWRIERLPALPEDEPIRVVPDWACEVLSPSTARHDQLVKKPFWGRAGLEWLWFIEPVWRSLQVFRLVDGRWTDHALYAEGGKVRADPFAEIELELDLLWPPPSPSATPAPSKKKPRRRAR